jgi:hypothetical protein
MKNVTRKLGGAAYEQIRSDLQKYAASSQITGSDSVERK